MLNITDLKPGMYVSVRDLWMFYPRCLVVTFNYELMFISLEGNYWIHPFFDADVVEVVE